MMEKSSRLRKFFPVTLVLMLLFAASYGLLLVNEEPADGATSVGSIIATGGTVKTFNNVNYLLDGDIVVSGSGSSVTFTNSTITLSQDVGIDGSYGGGDDHNYTIRVENGGRLELINSRLTTQTGQLNPYFKIVVIADGAGSSLMFEDADVEGPGEFTITNGAHFKADTSYFYELQDQSSLAYDIDGDGSTSDDVDYNDDGPKFTFSSGSTGLIVDSELRDTFSFNTPTRDGLTAGNITVQGLGTNLTVINSFLDVDFESNRSTGSHNMLKLENGAIAHLVSVAVNMSASTTAQHPAFYVVDTSSKIVYYRWIGAQVLDGMGIQAENEDVTVYRVEGNRDLRLTSSYLTSDILNYMGRNSLTWSDTGSDGWAFLPVITDVFTLSSMPNSDSYPDFKVSVNQDGEYVQASTSFQNYPNLPDKGDIDSLLQNARDGRSVSSEAISMLGGPLNFKKYIISPSTSSFFSGLNVDLTVTSETSLRGTSSVIDGVFYPSYYAFDGHLIVRSGGHLEINDTTVTFLTDDAPAYIHIENGGVLELNNVSLSGHGENELYIYLTGPGDPTLAFEGGDISIGHLVGRDSALVDVNCEVFNGSLNLIGPNVDVKISSNNIRSKHLYAEDCMLQMDGNPVRIDNLGWSGVSFHSFNSTFTNTLDIDNYAMLTNATFIGSLPQGRSGWLKPIGSGVIGRAWWVNGKVVDSVDNKLPGSVINVQRVDGPALIDVSSHTTDEKGISTFPLVQEELRASGRTYLGNYRLTASFRGYSSNPTTTLITGGGADAVITIPGGPNLVPQGLSVKGTLIDGFMVSLIGNITNVGEFDADPFKVSIEIDGESIGEVEVDGLAANAFTEVMIDWMTEEGETDIGIVIDPMNEVAETGEDDNTFNQMNVIGLGPDYTVDIDMPTQTWAYSTEGIFDIVIRNEGDEDPEQNSFHVDILWVSGLDQGIIAENITFNYITPGSFIVHNVNWKPMITGLVTIRVDLYSKYDRVPINSYDVEMVNILTLPDLKVALNSFQVDSPIPVTINTSVDIHLTIENVGELPAGDFMVRLYDTDKLPKNMIGSEYLVQGLDPEGSIDISFAWSTGLPIGYHDIIVVIDEIDSIAEQDETNNEVIYQVMVDTPPDLTFTNDIGGSPKIVTEGKNMTFWATVTNIGRTKAMDARIHFYIDSDTNVIESRSIDISPGQEMNVSFGWTAEGIGLHTLFIVADYWNSIAEPVETNNLKTIDFKVISKPDLFMEDNDLRVESDGDIEIGENVEITATIRNSGETDANNVFVRFYDGDPSLGGKIISWKETQPSVSINKIEAGGIRFANVTWVPQTGGFHDIYVVLDLANAIDESDEDNNKVSWPVYVLTLPDLTFSSLLLFQGDFEVDSAGVGRTLIINATLDNVGDTAAPAFKVNIFNGEFENDPKALPLGTDIVYLDGTLKGNSKMFIEMPWRVGYPKGIRTIIVTTELIDGTEQFTSNNMISVPIEIFDINDVPELIPLNETLSINTGYPGIEIDMETNPIAYQGMNISLDLSISNIGGKAASNTSILFMASNLTDEWVEYRTAVPFIENNGTDFISGFWNLRDVGINVLKIIVDPENGIREFDEGNNILTLALEVKEAPDVTISLVRSGDHFNLETGQFDMTKGKEYEISFQVQNLGNNSFTGLLVGYNGPAGAPQRTINLAPYQTQTITYTVKTDLDAGQIAVWKCRVNQDGKFYESDTSNNEINSVVNILEPEPESMMWLVILIIVIILMVLAGVAGYFIYTKFRVKDQAKCSNCGGLVDIDATLCPHCGIEFSDELECECGEVIPTGATECPACGRPVAGEPILSEEGGEEKDEEIDEEVEEEEEASSEEFEPSEDIEEIEEIEEEPAAQEAGEEEELAECFECGALIPVSAPICPHCGAVFE